VIEALAMVKVQCKHLIWSFVSPSHNSSFFGICSLANFTDGFEVIITFDWWHGALIQIQISLKNIGSDGNNRKTGMVVQRSRRLAVLRSAA
jgi:hypothetical protein